MYQKNIKENNENKIFEYVFNSNHNFVINEVAEKMDMSFPTVKRIITFFLEKNIIIEEDKVGSGVGRKAREYSFNDFFCHSVGVQISEEKIKMILTNAKGIVIKKHSKTLQKGGLSITDSLMEELEFFLSRLSKTIFKSIIGIGISVPGIVNEEGKFIEFNSKNKTDISIIEKIKKRFNIPVLVENESNLSAIAEAFLSENSLLSNFTALTLNDYVGISSFTREKNQNDFHFKAGRMHHMIVNPEGKSCGCGSRGYWGAYVSNKALVEEFHEVFKKVKKYENIFQDEYLETEEGKKILDEYIKYLAIGIKNLLFFSNPEKLIISGKICLQQKYIKERLLEEIYTDHIFYRGKETIIFSSFEESSSLIGAALFPIVDSLF